MVERPIDEEPPIAETAPAEEPKPKRRRSKRPLPRPTSQCPSRPRPKRRRPRPPKDRPSLRGQAGAQARHEEGRGQRMPKPSNRYRPAANTDTEAETLRRAAPRRLVATDVRLGRKPGFMPCSGVEMLSARPMNAPVARFARLLMLALALAFAGVQPAAAAGDRIGCFATARPSCCSSRCRSR